jgi:Tol biopolymer transport system component
MRAKAVIALLLLLIPANQSFSQYFGRNKIHAPNLNFTMLSTAHYDIYCYSIENHALVLVAEMLERWHERFSRIFHFSLEHQIVIIYRNRSDFTQTSIMSDLVEQGLGGVREPQGRRILLSLTGINACDEHLVGHEVANAFQFSLIVRSSLPLLPAQTFPAWFMEGMAEYLTLGRDDRVTAMWLRNLRETGLIPSFYAAGHNEDLYSPYHVGHAIWAFMTGAWGDSMIAPLCSSIIRHGWESGFRRTLGMSADSVSLLWQHYAAKSFSGHPGGGSPGGCANPGVNLFPDRESRLSPSVSPDGRRVAFIQAIGKFTRSISIADAETGKNLQTVLSFNRDAHLEEISFDKSSGEWAPDGTKFAVTAYDRGASVIEVVDLSLPSGPRVIGIPGVDEITGLGWSPDGHAMVISSSSGGEDRLYLYDLGNASLVTLEKGPYTCVQPCWSPDGKTIAYVTDSGPSTRLDEAVYGPLRICLLDITGGRRTILELGDRVEAFCPRFSPDGGNVYFIADPDGFSDLYRYDRANGNVFRLTKAPSGVCGLARYSPSFSAALDSNIIVYCSLDSGRFTIHRLADSCLRGSPFGAADTAGYDAVIPLAAGSGNEITRSYLNDWRGGLIPSQFLYLAPYNPRWSLRYAGQYFIGSAGNEYGLNAGSGSLIFSDVLGNRLISMAGQIDTLSPDGIGLMAGYLNQTGRYYWGVSASHLPYQTPQVLFTKDSSSVNSRLVPAQTTTVLRQRNFTDEANFVLQDPLSVNTRLEFNLTYALQSFENYVTRTTQPSGGLPAGTRLPSPSAPPPPIQTVALTGAYIGDYSLDGYTAPRSGNRFHLEAGPVVGSVFYGYVQADYRYYLLLKPVTLAFRAMHVGEYGGELKSGELPVLNLGFPTWVRGYSTRSFDFSKGINDTGKTGEGATFDRLIGSKVAIGNAELRLPILGSQQIGLVDFAYLPTDFILFTDGGLAWINNRGVTLQLSGNPDERAPVFSTGFGLRSNLVGALVGSVFLVYPVERPHRHPFLDYEISTGW